MPDLEAVDGDPSRSVTTSAVLARMARDADFRGWVLFITLTGGALFSVIATSWTLTLICLGALFGLLAFEGSFAYSELVRERDPERPWGVLDTAFVVVLSATAVAMVIVAVAVA